MHRVRDARVEDILRIYDLGLELLDDSFYRGIKVNDTKFKRTVAMLIGSKLGKVLVIADEQDIAQGFLVGMADELFFSNSKFVTDLCMYARPDARYMAGFMIKRFLRWGMSVKGVVEITLGISSGMGDPERIGRIYERLGLTRVGGLYMMRVAA